MTERHFIENQILAYGQLNPRNNEQCNRIMFGVWRGGDYHLEIFEKGSNCWNRLIRDIEK